MVRGAITLGLLLGACGPAGSTGVDATPSAPGGAAAARSRAGDARAPGSEAAGDTDAEAGAASLLGVVGQTGVEHCVDPGKMQWLDVRPTIGFVPIHGIDDATLEPLMDLPVWAQGVVASPPPRATPEVERVPCPPMQMRSDWVSTPRGIRQRRGDPLGISGFRVHRVRRLHELGARREGEDVIVGFTNPLPEAMREVSLVVHYEGCFGKPGTHAETFAVGELASGASTSARAPVLWVEPRGPTPYVRPRSYRAFSVELRGSAPDTMIDLDARLGALGLPIECPDRK